MAVHDHDGRLTQTVILHLDEDRRNTGSLPLISLIIERLARVLPCPFVFLEQLDMM
jgi:hypothetical protein